MGRSEKRIRTWLNNTPKEAPIEEVDAVLERHFAGKIRVKSGSHRVVRDRRLASYYGFEPYGEFTVVVKSGQRVKGFYLKRLAEAVRIIEELERKDDEGS
jgi:hypothetical protein